MCNVLPLEGVFQHILSSCSFYFVLILHTGKSIFGRAGQVDDHTLFTANAVRYVHVCAFSERPNPMPTLQS